MSKLMTRQIKVNTLNPKIFNFLTIHVNTGAVQESRAQYNIKIQPIKCANNYQQLFYVMNNAIKPVYKQNLKNKCY